MAVYCAVGAIRWVMADDGVRQPPMVGKWRTSGTQSLVSRRIPARYAALCIPGYGRVPSLCDETNRGMTFLQPLFGGSSACIGVTG